VRAWRRSDTTLVCYDQTVSTPPGAQPPDLGELLDDLAVRIERVKVLYEQYFMGIEKIEPQVARKDISRHMLVLQQQYIRNTGLRFRFNTMLQKWNIYVAYWNRILREIENGTYVRHIQKAARRAQSEGRELPREMLPPPQRHEHDIHAHDTPMPSIHDEDSGPVTIGTRSAVEDLSTEPGLERIQPSAPPTPLFPPAPPKDAPKAPARPPPAPPDQRAAALLRPPPQPARPQAAIPGMTEDELHALHRRFVATRAMNGETARVSYETLITSLAKQVPKVLQQPGAKGVRFEVAVQNGRAILKAIPTK
jgi:hypothetical protein